MEEHVPTRTICVRAVDAFVACGGNSDKTGHVHRDTLVRIIKHDFGLTIDIEVRRARQDSFALEPYAT